MPRTSRSSAGRDLEEAKDAIDALYEIHRRTTTQVTQLEREKDALEDWAKESAKQIDDSTRLIYTLREENRVSREALTIAVRDHEAARFHAENENRKLQADAIVQENTINQLRFEIGAYRKTLARMRSKLAELSGAEDESAPKRSRVVIITSDSEDDGTDTEEEV